MLRIWDTFLYEGSKVLFRFAIAIFKYNEEAILATENSIGIFNKLRTMCQDATDVNRLVQVSIISLSEVCIKLSLSLSPPSHSPPHRLGSTRSIPFPRERSSTWGICTGYRSKLSLKLWTIFALKVLCQWAHSPLCRNQRLGTFSAARTLFPLSLNPPTKICWQRRKVMLKKRLFFHLYVSLN